MLSGISVQLVIFLVVMSASAISWLIKTLKEQRAKKAEAQAKQRANEEMLRTGRTADKGAMAPVGTVSMESAQERLREIARKRQEQLRELRRRETQMAGGRGGEARGTPAPMPDTAPAARPARPIAAAPTVAAPRPPAPVSRPRPVAVPANKVPPRREPPRAEPRLVPPATARRADWEAEGAGDARRREAAPLVTSARDDVLRAQAGSTRAGSAGPAKADAAAIAPAWPLAGSAGGTIAAWRQAFIMSELLAPPVAMRPPGLPGSGVINF